MPSVDVPVKVTVTPTLFFTYPRQLSREQFMRIKEQLTEQLPDARVCILEGGFDVKQMWTGDPEVIARAFHENYERFAPAFGYETREESKGDWEDVPAENRNLMIAVVEQLLEDGVIS